MRRYKLVEYILSKVFLKNLGFYIGGVIILFFLVFLMIRIYTDHGDAFSVPDFRGMTLQSVEKLAKEKNLNFEVFDSVYSSDYFPGTVVEQHPVAGFRVKKHHTVYLTMNAVGKEKTIMPELVGHTLRQARSMMLTYGLQVGKLTYVYDIAKNVVLEQHYQGRTINKGDTLVKGSFIDLTLGKGLGNDKTMVPQLIDLTREEAKIKAADYYFSLGAVNMDGSVISKSDSQNARVFMQRPEHNENNLVPLGSSIDIWLTNDTTKIPVSDTLKAITNEPDEIP